MQGYGLKCCRKKALKVKRKKTVTYIESFKYICKYEINIETDISAVIVLVYLFQWS